MNTSLNGSENEGKEMIEQIFNGRTNGALILYILQHYNFTSWVIRSLVIAANRFETVSKR
jgi:hypothetical protein